MSVDTLVFRSESASVPRLAVFRKRCERQELGRVAWHVAVEPGQTLRVKGSRMSVFSLGYK